MTSDFDVGTRCSYRRYGNRHIVRAVVLKRFLFMRLIWWHVITTLHGEPLYEYDKSRW